MASSDAGTLEISGLSHKTEQACREIYEQFLKDHDLGSYPVKITVTQTPDKYLLAIICGEFGIDHIGHTRLTSSPEFDIIEELHWDLEAQYECHQTMIRNRERRRNKSGSP